MKPEPLPVTLEQITAAVLVMAEMIPFAPQTKVGQGIVISAIERFLSTDEQLAWLTDAAINHMRKFSLPELRGLFCTRWKPRDGVQEYSTIAGFTTADLEGQFIERQAQETAALIEKWKTEKQLAPASTIEPFVLPPGAGPKLLQKPERVAAPVDDSRPLAEREADALRNIGPPRSPEETARLARELAEAVERRQKKA